MNWIVPGKILAFSSPTEKKNDGLQPDAFLANFQKMNIKGIIRLNESLYDEDVFREAGIEVYDSEFPDGSCPSDVRFLVVYLSNLDRYR